MLTTGSENWTLIADGCAGSRWIWEDSTCASVKHGREEKEVRISRRGIVLAKDAQESGRSTSTWRMKTQGSGKRGVALQLRYRDVFSSRKRDWEGDCRLGRGIFSERVGWR